MKMKFAFLCTAIAEMTVAFHAHSGILAGPILNPANGHEYYLLTPNTWVASETEAERMGGTLAIVSSAGAQEWVFSTFASYGGINRSLWIGLHRTSLGGPFAWMTGTKLDYANWAAGQPDNGGGVENAVQLYAPGSAWPGFWNDVPELWNSVDNKPSGVVEVSGKSMAPSLGEVEKSLIGVWYQSGDEDRPCWIAGAENMLFADPSWYWQSRLMWTKEGFLFASNWREHGELVKDKIVWSSGSWWSRQPAAYRNEANPPPKEPARTGK
jgi:Lectin C-type domain